MRLFKLNLILIFTVSSTCTCFETEGSSSGSVVITAGTVQCVSTCIVHPGTSESGYAEITIKGFISYQMIKYFNFKYTDINLKHGS